EIHDIVKEAELAWAMVPIHADNNVVVDATGTLVDFKDASPSSRLCQSRLPLWFNKSTDRVLYFEVDIIEILSHTVLAVGMAPSPYPSNVMVGQERFSFAYASDVNVHWENPPMTKTMSPVSIKKRFGTGWENGDIIGCAFNASKVRPEPFIKMIVTKYKFCHKQNSVMFIHKKLDASVPVIREIALKGIPTKSFHISMSCVGSAKVRVRARAPFSCNEAMQAENWLTKA
ncbi:hypothetical protein HDU99_006810, partial [Rhizoclosmatium hyalinum]